MIIDCEVYDVTEPMAGRTFGLDGLETLLADAGVATAVVMPEVAVQPDNRALADRLAARAPGRVRFLPCAWVNPQFGADAVRELEVAVREWGFCALKLMPTHHAFRPVTAAAHPLMAKAAELGIPVTVHSGSAFAHPLEIAELAAAFPTVPVILDHMGYRYFVPEAIAGARRVPNLYLATTAVMEPHFIRQAVRALGAERVMFGSNAPNVFPATQRLVIEQAELSDAETAMVLGGAAARVFSVG